MTAVVELNKDVVITPKEAPVIRRFELADLSKHGGWIMQRLLKAYKHRNERDLAGWLRGILYSPEFMFLYHEHAVGLFMTGRINPLVEKPIIQELFCWCEDAKNDEHITAAAAFYEEILTQAKHRNVDIIIVEYSTDVPHEIIREKLEKRLFTRTEHFVKV